MKRHPIFLFVLATATLIGVSPTLAQLPAAQSTPIAQAITRDGIVNATRLNVRSAPGTNNRILYTLPGGARVTIYQQTSMGDSVWYSIKPVSSQYSMQQGWVAGRYITITSANGVGPGPVAPPPSRPNPPNQPNQAAIQAEETCMRKASEQGYRTYSRTAAERGGSFYFVEFQATTPSGSQVVMTCRYNTASRTASLENIRPITPAPTPQPR